MNSQNTMNLQTDHLRTAQLAREKATKTLYPRKAALIDFAELHESCAAELKNSSNPATTWYMDYDAAIASSQAKIATLEKERDEARAALREESMRDGSWIDKWGSCRVCGGEIPHGHSDDCDLYKLEQKVLRANESVQILEKDKSWKLEAYENCQRWTEELGFDAFVQVISHVNILRPDNARMRKALDCVPAIIQTASGLWSALITELPKEKKREYESVFAAFERSVVAYQDAAALTKIASTQP